MKKAIIMAVIISLVMALIYGVSVACILEHDRDYFQTVNSIITKREREASYYEAEMNEKIFLAKSQLGWKIRKEGRDEVSTREISRYYDTKEAIFAVSFEDGHEEWYVVNYETGERKLFRYTR